MIRSHTFCNPQKSMAVLRKIAAAGLGVFMTLSLAACGGKAAEPKTPIADIAASIVEKMPGGETMAAVEQDRLSNYYKFAEGDVDDFVLYIEGSGGFADEVGIFHVANPDHLNNVQDACSERLEVRRKDFTGYNPDEETKIDNSVILTQGNYILVLVSEDSDTLKTTFTEAFTK